MRRCLPHSLSNTTVRRATVPPLLIVQHAIPADDPPALLDFLRARRDGKVEIVVPQRGERDATRGDDRGKRGGKSRPGAFALADGRAENDRRALSELQEALGLSGWPRRIECYDISNTQGTNSVASMVVFEDARPKKSDYRKFAIKTVEGPNDFASMNEVIGRRFKRLQAPDAAARQAGLTGRTSSSSMVARDNSVRRSMRLRATESRQYADGWPRQAK